MTESSGGPRVDQQTGEWSLPSRRSRDRWSREVVGRTGDDSQRVLGQTQVMRVIHWSREQCG